jgi:hypothetical protein
VWGGDAVEVAIIVLEYADKESHCLDDHALKVCNALLERVGLLLGRDRLPHVAHDPVHHVLLLHAAHHVCKLELVVQTLLHLKYMEGKVKDGDGIFIQRRCAPSNTTRSKFGRDK